MHTGEGGGATSVGTKGGSREIAGAQVSYCFVALPTTVSNVIFTYIHIYNHHLIAVAQVSYYFVALPTNIISSVIFTGLEPFIALIILIVWTHDRQQLSLVAIVILIVMNQDWNQ